MMKRMTMICLALTVFGVLCGPMSRAGTAKVRIVAYINQSSGCQVPTETFLKNLAAKYPGRVELKFVNFGEPKGREIWQKDGMHCMGIKIDGSTKADIVYKGVKLNVAFEMPVGYRWLHEELATAVRQKLDGVKPSDKVGPPISTKKVGNKVNLLAGSSVILAGLDADTAKTLAATLTKAGGEKPIVQDDFSVKPASDGARITLRGKPLYFLPKGSRSDDEFGKWVVKTFLGLIAPFPRISRPFPSLKPPPRRR